MTHQKFLKIKIVNQLALAAAKLSILCKIEMSPLVTEISYSVPYLDRSNLWLGQPYYMNKAFSRRRLTIFL